MKLKFLYLSILLLCTYLPSQAQIDETYSVDLEGALNFQTITASGTWIIGSDAGLAAYDQENGTELWIHPNLAKVSASDVSEIPGSTLLMVRQEDDVKFIDPYSGAIRFSTEEQGFNELSFERMLYRSNGLLIGGKKGKNEPVLAMVDLATGEVRWKLEENFGRIITATEFSAEEILLVTLLKVYRMKSQDGSIIWKEATSKETAAMGGALSAFANKMAANVEFNIRYYENIDKDIFLLGFEVENTKTVSDGKTIVSYTNNYTAFKLSSGARVWSDPVELDGHFGVVEFHNDKVIVLPDDGNRTKINAFDINSGEGLWGKKGRGLKLKGGVYDAFTTDKGMLLVSTNNKKTFLNFLDVEAGVLTYDKPTKVKGIVMELQMAGDNFAYVTSEEMNILDPASGELLLDQSLATNPELTVIDGDKMIVADPNKGLINSVNLKTNEVKEIFSDKLKFGGKENPQQLEIRENGYLLSSEQNLALISSSGELAFNKHYPAPRESGLKQALLYAQAARAAYISANAYSAAGALQSAAPKVTEEDAVSGALVEGLGTAYQEVGEQAQDFAKKSIEQARSRAKATTQGRDFMIILSDVGKEFALVKVNKDTGEAEGEISLGKEKEPKYAVDDVTGKVFRKSEATKVSVYQL